MGISDVLNYLLEVCILSVHKMVATVSPLIYKYMSTYRCVQK